jgi:transposase
MNQAGQSIRKISRILKMSRKTIRRILSGSAPTEVKKPSRYESLAPLVCELFNRFAGNAVSVQNELAHVYGYQLPYTSLTHMVRSLKLRPDKIQRSGSFSYPPGREAQHDTSPHRVSIAGKIVKAQCASLVLANSRLLFFQYYPRFTRFEAKIFLTAALAYLDAVPQICVIDNTSVLVAAGSGADAIIAPEMEAFGAIYGMRFVAHAIGHADRSALVERNFHYIEASFLPGQDFSSWPALNAAARRWCDEVANTKIKRALGMSPRQA